MRLQLITDPKSIDLEKIAQMISDGTRRIVLQFGEKSYGPALLEDVNDACKSFGSKLNVRFYGHHQGDRNFDCKWLRYLPDVRSLSLDCLTGIRNDEEIARLEHLEEFAFGVFEADLPDLLRTHSLTRVRKLILADSRKNNIDLAPLVGYDQLEVLFLNSHAKNIATLAVVPAIRKLSLGSIRRTISVSFIGQMKNLRSLTLILGGRDTVRELAQDGLLHLEILRVRGLAEVDLSLFQCLQTLVIEDQLRLLSLDLEKGRELSRLAIWNCKKFTELTGLRNAAKLESLRLGETAVSPDSVLQNAPPSLKDLSLYVRGNRKNEELKARIKTIGLR